MDKFCRSLTRLVLLLGIGVALALVIIGAALVLYPAQTLLAGLRCVGVLAIAAGLFLFLTAFSR